MLISWWCFALSGRFRPGCLVSMGWWGALGRFSSVFCFVLAGWLVWLCVCFLSPVVCPGVLVGLFFCCPVYLGGVLIVCLGLSCEGGSISIFT